MSVIVRSAGHNIFHLLDALKKERTVKRDYSWITSQVDEIPGRSEEVLEKVYEIAERMVSERDFRDLATLKYWDLCARDPAIRRFHILPLGYGLNGSADSLEIPTLFYLTVGTDKSFKVNPLSRDFIHGVNLKDIKDFGYVGGRRFEPIIG